jgi:two-component system cell cycle sensor histidine kinase/response regulator CckA
MHWTLEELIGAFRCSVVPVQVLVVDDDVTSRAATRRTLEHLGYSVIVAEQSAGALRLLEGSHTPIDLLVAEVGMPEMSGPGLAQALRERFPSLPVVFVSADFADRRRCGDIAPPVWFVPKPFLPAELIAAVHGALGVPHGPAVPQPAL